MDNQNELIERPSWWKRNWKWAVPAGGCLTIIIIAVVLIVGGAFAFANKIKTASGSDEALIQVQSNKEVIAVLGTPIESDGFGSFNISINNGVKRSNATTPIKGPNGTGVIHIITSGEDDEKVYEVYNVTIDASDQVIELEPKVIE
ncbi:cytochrome c oxidase assembly factor Coa1 family protein [uncultured Dokdonia sp.]|uniref:cytochrome c oxidase assembly factor Coa1 family protein n=1 Tax=uncultured Dokdonia sp. TaxID=575653 RepID=UPI0030EE8FC0|tara:strand:- start:186714 stop:187151 length:438 start_codon:yes stop_codon:yes gene_type:complete